MPKTLSEAEVAEFRTRLCETAARMFVEKGPEAVTMRTLARELGCSAMTPYRYFKDKQAILAAVRVKGFAELADALEAVRPIAHDQPANAAALAKSYLAFAFERPHVYRMMFDIPRPGDERDGAAIAAAKLRVCEALLGPIGRILAPGALKDQEKGACQMVMTTLHGAAMLKLSGMLDPGSCPEALVSRSLMAIAGALGPERGSRPLA